jgi:hypothetical protein
MVQYHHSELHVACTVAFASSAQLHGCHASVLASCWRTSQDHVGHVGTPFFCSGQAAQKHREVTPGLEYHQVQGVFELAAGCVPNGWHTV